MSTTISRLSIAVKAKLSAASAAEAVSAGGDGGGGGIGEAEAATGGADVVQAERVYAEAARQYNLTRRSLSEVRLRVEAYVLQLQRLHDTVLSVLDAADVFFGYSGDPTEGLTRNVKKLFAELGGAGGSSGGTAQQMLDGLRHGVLAPILSYQRELDSALPLIREYEEVQPLHRHYRRKVAELAEKLKADGRQDTAEKYGRNVAKLQDMTIRFRDVADRTCTTLIDLLDKRAEHFTPSLLRFAQFLHHYHLYQAWQFFDVDQEFNSLNALGPMSFTSFVPTTAVRHHQGYLHRRRALKKVVMNREDVYAVLVGNDMILYPNARAATLGLDVVESISVAFVTEWEEKEAVGFGVAGKDGSEHFFWTNAAETKQAWVNAVEVARQWDGLQSKENIVGMLERLRGAEQAMGDGLSTGQHFTNKYEKVERGRAINIQRVDPEQAVPINIPIPLDAVQGLVVEPSERQSVVAAMRQSFRSSSNSGASSNANTPVSHRKGSRSTNDAPGYDPTDVDPRDLAEIASPVSADSVFGTRGASASANTGADAAAAVHRRPPPPPKPALDEDDYDATEPVVAKRQPPPPPRDTPGGSGTPDLEPVVERDNETYGTDPGDLPGSASAGSTTSDRQAGFKSLFKKVSSAMSTTRESLARRGNGSNNKGMDDMMGISDTADVAPPVGSREAAAALAAATPTATYTPPGQAFPEEEAQQYGDNEGYYDAEQEEAVDVQVDWAYLGTDPSEVEYDFAVVFITLTDQPRLSFEELLLWPELADLLGSGGVTETDVVHMWESINGNTNQPLKLTEFVQFVGMLDDTGTDAGEDYGGEF